VAALALPIVAVLIVAHELVWRRAGRGLVAIAIGTAAGYAFVAALAFALFTCRGVAVEPRGYVVDAVLDGFDAATRLVPGDRIVAIDGVALRPPATPSLVAAVNARGGAPVTLDLERGGETRSVVLTPRLDHRDDGHTSWVLGIRARLEPDYDRGTGLAAGLALAYPIAELSDTVTELATTPPPPEMTGPKRIVDEFRIATDRWRWLKLAMRWCTFALAALLAVDLARYARTCFTRKAPRSAS